MIKTALNYSAILLILAALVFSGCAKPNQYTGAAEGDAPMETEKKSTDTTEATDTTKSAPGPATSTMDRTTKSLAEENADPALLAQIKEDGMLRIHFDFDRYVLSKESRKILTANAAFLSQMEQIKVLVEGHCDERGSDEYNMALGERRALATKNFLVSLGIDEGRIGHVSYGEEKPLDSGQNEAAWSKNRRAEFVAK